MLGDELVAATVRVYSIQREWLLMSGVQRGRMAVQIHVGQPAFLGRGGSGGGILHEPHVVRPAVGQIRIIQILMRNR